MDKTPADPTDPQLQMLLLPANTGASLTTNTHWREYTEDSFVTAINKNF